MADREKGGRQEFAKLQPPSEQQPSPSLQPIEQNPTIRLAKSPQPILSE